MKESEDGAICREEDGRGDSWCTYRLKKKMPNSYKKVNGKRKLKRCIYKERSKSIFDEAKRNVK